MKSRIAIFEGYRSPFSRAPSYGFRRSMGRPMGSSMGSPLGRRAYRVPAAYEFPRGFPETYGPPKLKRKAYRVKKGPNSPWQRKFKKIAETCARKSKHGRKGSYQSCMKKALKKAKKSKR
jgi:hypothetical protein